MATRREKLMISRLNSIVEKGESFVKGIKWFNWKHPEVLEYEGREDEFEGLADIKERTEKLMGDLYEILH